MIEFDAEPNGDTYPDDIPPGVEEAMHRELAVHDFRRASFLRLMRLPPCIDCGRHGTWWDSDPPEVFYCDCPAGERAVLRAREDRDYREGMLGRWASRAAEQAARPRCHWVKPPAPAEPGGALQATLRRLQRLLASSPWLDRYANGERSEGVLELLRARPWDGPQGLDSLIDVRATPRRPERAYRLARARWIAGEGCHSAFRGSELGLRDGDAMGRIAGGWLDRVEHPDA